MIRPRRGRGNLICLFMRLNCFGVGVAPGHHRRPLGEARTRLPERHIMLFGQLAELAGRGLRKFRVGREGDVLGLHRGVHRDPGQIALAQGTGVVGNPQAFLQQNLQLVADAFSPVAHAGTLVRQVMPEKFLAGEVPETGVVHPAGPDLLVGEGRFASECA